MYRLTPIFERFTCVPLNSHESRLMMTNGGDFCVLAAGFSRSPVINYDNSLSVYFSTAGSGRRKRKTLQICCSPTMDARKIFGIFNYHKDERNLSSFLYSFCFRRICVALMIGLGISSVCLSNFQSLNIFASLRKNLIIIAAFSHITFALERAKLISTYDRFSLPQILHVPPSLSVLMQVV